MDDGTSYTYTGTDESWDTASARDAALVEVRASSGLSPDAARLALSPRTVVASDPLDALIAEVTDLRGVAESEMAEGEVWAPAEILRGDVEAIEGIASDLGLTLDAAAWRQIARAYGVAR